MANEFKNVGVAVSATGNITDVNNTPIYVATVPTIFHAVYISNVDGVNDAQVNLAVSNGDSNWFHIARSVDVPKNSTLVLDKPINLAEGDLFAASASAAGDIEIVGSLLEMS